MMTHAQRRAARHSGDPTLTPESQDGAAAPQSETAIPAATLSSEEILGLVIASLEDDKAEDILVIDLSGKTAIADSMVIASGRSARHVSTTAEKLMDRLKTQAGMIARNEGVEFGDWALIDAGDVIVHLFRPEVREFYELEKMWQAAPQAASQGAA